MKKVKLFLSILISCIFLIALILIIIYIGQVIDNKNELSRREYISELIDIEVKLSNPKDDNTNTSGDLDIEDIVSGSINDSKIESVFSDIKMINSSTFTATLNQETKTYRLIGVSADGNKEMVKTILESLEFVIITRDFQPRRNNIEQIYLWSDEDTGNINNMINIQIVASGICKTTYTEPSHSEAPNIKYSSMFVQASKKPTS